MSKSKGVSLTYLIKLFIKVGSISFGGFMALIAVLQKQVVEKDKKLDDHVLLDAISLASILPGPVAVNVVGYVGNYLRGFWGSIFSMAAVIFPSFLLVLGLSVYYFESEEIGYFQQLIGLMIPAIVVIIFSVGINMVRKQIKSWEQYLIGGIAMTILQIIGGIWATLGVIFIGGLIGYLVYGLNNEEQGLKTDFKLKLPKQLLQEIASVFTILLLSFIAIYIIGGEELFYLTTKIFVTFSSMSLSLFGGGYVFIPIIQETIVDQMQWLSSSEFNTAIAISQITPGPILISATFIGYKLAGVTGAIMATIGIFLPSGLLIITCSNYLHQVSNSLLIKSIFKGLRPAIIGLIFSAGITIFRQEYVIQNFIIVFAITFIISIWFRLSTIWIILLAIGLGLIGLLMQ